MLAVLALLVGAQPAVALDPKGPLAEALCARLLDEGYRLVPAAAAADLELIVTAVDGGLRLVARGASGPPDERWIEDGPAGAVRLDVLQQAVLLVRAHAIDVPRSRERAAVLRLDGPGAAVAWPHVAARLLAADHAVAAQAVEGDRVVCATLGEAEVAWAVIAAGAGCPPEPARARIAQDAGERWIDAVIARLDAEVPPVPTPLAEAVEPVEPVESMEPAAALALGVGGGATVRGGGVDPSVGVTADFGRSAGLGGALRTAVTFATGARTLGITELSFTAGPRYRWALGERVSVEAGVAAGVRVHVWSVDAASAGFVVPSGVRLEVLAELPVRASARVLGPLQLDLWAAPGIAGGGRSHTAEGTTLWERSPLQVAVGLGLSNVLAGGNSAVGGE